MKKILIIGLLLLTLAAVGAAVYNFPYSPYQPPAVDDTGTTTAGVQEVVDANNQFAFDMYAELEESESGNLFFSPYSISAAIGMVYEGAKEETAEEIKEVFHFPRNNVLRPNFAAIYNDINEQEGCELRTGNALWMQKNYPFLESYTSTVENYYGGKAVNMDFIGQPEESRETINSFIEEQTNNRIKDLLPSGSINDRTRLIITNAIYFKGDWKWEFDKSDTYEGNFKTTPEKVVKTDMMRMKPEKAMFNYANLEKLKIIELPYKGDELSMLIILPKQETDYDPNTGEQITLEYTLDDIELTYDKLQEYKSQMEETKMETIVMPKFEFDTKYTLNQYLASMGMPTAFNQLDANFTGMTEAEQLYISLVVHQAFVKVDEKGTEAAAATGVIMMANAMPSQDKIFRADHPFVFIIQQRETGNILFMGKVSDPRE